MHNRKPTTLNHGLKTGLFINPSKTKSMRINVHCNDKLQIYSTDIEDVQNFTYLGIVNTSWGTDEDIAARERKAQQTF